MPQLVIEQAGLPKPSAQVGGVFGWSPSEQAPPGDGDSNSGDREHGDETGVLRITIPAPATAAKESAPDDSISPTESECLDPFKALLEPRRQPTSSASADGASLPQRDHPNHQQRGALLIPQPTSSISTHSNLIHISKPKQASYLHFNSRGEILNPVAPSFNHIKPPTLLQNPYPNPNINIRVCMRFGCSSLLRAENPDAFCATCKKDDPTGLLAKPRGPSPLADNPYKHLVRRSANVELDLELSYPEEEPPSSSENGHVSDGKTLPNIPQVASSSTGGEDQPPLKIKFKNSKSTHLLKPSKSDTSVSEQQLTVPSQATLPSQPRLLPEPRPQSSYTSSSLPLPPYFDPASRAPPQRHRVASPNSYGGAKGPPSTFASRPSQSSVKQCVTQGCSGLIHAQSAAQRCPTCVMKDWKQKSKAMKGIKAQVKARADMATAFAPKSTIPAPSTSGSSSSLADVIQQAFRLPTAFTPVSSPKPSQKDKVEGPSSSQPPRADPGPSTPIFLRIPSTSQPRRADPGPSTPVSLRTPSTSQPQVADTGPSTPVFLRLPSKRKLEEMIDLTKSASGSKASSPQKKDMVEAESVETRKPSPVPVPQPKPSETDAEAAMDVDAPSNDSVITSSKGKEKMNPQADDTTPMDVDLSLDVTGWDSDLTSLSELEGCGDTTDEEEEPAHPKLIIRLPPMSFANLPPEQRPNPPGTHYRREVLGRGVLSASSGEQRKDVDAPTQPPSTEEKPVNSVPSGKKCAIPKCKDRLPVGYKWKCCRSCREHHREYQRKRLGITKGSYSTEKEDFKPVQKPKEQVPMILVSKIVGKPVIAPSGSRICVIRGCGLLIPPVEEYKWKLCPDCKKRANKTRLRRQLRAEGKEDPALDQEIEHLRALWKKRIVSQVAVVPSQPSTAADAPNIASTSTPPTVPVEAKARSPSYPEYPALPLLVSDFSQRLAGFFEGQAMYAMLHPQQRTVTTFGFDGEYSVVAMDMEILGRRDAILDFVGRVKGEIERVGGLAFDPRSQLVSHQHGGILTRFACRHALGPVWMEGELEIAILPEYSHRYFPGQMTVVRFRMVG